MPPEIQKTEKTSSTPTPEKPEVKFLFVQNTTKQLHGIPQALKKEEQLAAGALIQPMLLNLMPGLNKVSLTAWETAKAQKMVQTHLTEGNFKEIDAVSDFGEINPDEARNLINLCVDVKLLEEWKTLDKRGLIQKAIDNRLASVTQQEPGTVRPSEVKGLR